jgi:hypothetical protein
MNLVGEVVSVISSKDHGRGAFDNVGIMVQAHPTANQNPYVFSIHCEPDELKMGDKVTISK